MADADAWDFGEWGQRMMRTRVVVEITPSRVRLTSSRSEGGSWSRAITPAEHEDEWAGVLAACESALAEGVAELGVTGAPATVVYRHPGTTVGVYPCPTKAGPRRIEQSVELALTDSFEAPLSDHPWGTQIVARDGKPASDDAEAPARQTHVLGTAEQEGVSAGLVSLVQRVGLRAESLVPMDAISMCSAVRALTTRGLQGVKVGLWLGEHGSVLGVSIDSRLHFVRQIGLGVVPLVDAYVRATAVASDGDSVATREQARGLLTRGGVPKPVDVIDEERGLRGSHVLPLIQPVLQRSIVETKQSLRFGLTPEQRDAACFVLMGECVVPRLEAVIAAEAELGVDEDEALANSNVTDRPSINLLPRAMQDRAKRSRVERVAWAGVAAAGLLMGLDWFETSSEIGVVRQQLQAQSQMGQNRAQLDALRARLGDARAGLEDAERRLRERLTPTPSWAHVLAAIAAETPDGVEFSEIQLVEGERGSKGVLTGVVVADTPQDGTGVVTDYLASLTDHPLVRGAKLGYVIQTSEDRESRQLIEVSLDLVDVTPATVRTVAAVSEGAGS